MKDDFHCFVEPLNKDIPHELDALKQIYVDARTERPHALFPIADLYRKDREHSIMIAHLRGRMPMGNIHRELVKQRFSLTPGSHLWAFERSENCGYLVQVSKVSNVVHRFGLDLENPMRETHIRAVCGEILQHSLVYASDQWEHVQSNLKLLPSVHKYVETVRSMDKPIYQPQKEKA